jgi:hypothetical protein
MAITATNIAPNHRSVYYEYTGDGSTTASTVQLSHKFIRPNMTASAFVVTVPTALSNKSGRGGMFFPDGTNATVASCSISATGLVTVTTSAAVTNAVKAYVVVVLDQIAD